MDLKTYGCMKLSDCGKEWIIESLEPHVSIRFKKLFPAVKRTSIPPYRVPHNMIADADIEWFTQRYPLDMPPEARDLVHAGCVSFKARQEKMEQLLLPSFKSATQASLREGQEVRPYQWQAIEILRHRGKLLLGDDMGLGKTYTALGFLASEPSSLPAAVVCDAHMAVQWQEKLEAFTNLRAHRVKKTSPYQLPDADVFIFRVSLCSGWADIFATDQFKTAIFDEPQSLRTGTSTQKGQACKVLSDHTTYHCGLTATPVFNYGDEMWRVMQFIDDEVLGSWADFYRRNHAKEGPGGLLRHQLSEGHCVGHGPGTWDFIVGDFS